MSPTSNIAPRAGLRALVLATAGALGAAGLSAAGCGGDGGGGLEDSTPEVHPAPGGLRRLTRAQIENTLSDLLGSSAAASLALPEDQRLHGYSAIAAADNALTATDVSAFESSFTAAVAQALLEPAAIAALAPCVASPDDACFEQVARSVGRAAWRRPLAEDEVATLTGIAAQGKAWGMGSFAAGLEYELLTILQSPRFLYLIEIGAEDDGSGYRKLDAFELASRMAFFLTDRGPDAELLDAAERGRLEGEDDVRAQARRLLAKPEAQRAFDRFAGEIYAIDDLSNVSKDPDLYPGFGAPLAASMRESMLAFLRDVVFARDADARELFTSRDYFVDATLAPLYGLTASGSEMVKVRIPEAQPRAGLIGQAGLLARFAHPALTSPTRRGRFVQERLLCNNIPAPPPGLNTNIPEEPPGMPMTMKQKLSAHQAQAGCAGCHERMDPIGFALESYDAIGAFRSDDRGLPLDTSGRIAELGVIASAADIGEALAKSDAAATCFVRHLVRGSMGHLELPGEEGAIRALGDRFAEGGYRLQSLMIDLCASPAFRLVDAPK